MPPNEALVSFEESKLAGESCSRRIYGGGVLKDDEYASYFDSKDPRNN